MFIIAIHSAAKERSPALAPGPLLIDSFTPVAYTYLCMRDRLLLLLYSSNTCVLRAGWARQVYHPSVCSPVGLSTALVDVLPKVLPHY